MKHGHVTGYKQARQPRQATLDRYKALGAAIQQQLAGKTVQGTLDDETRQVKRSPEHTRQDVASGLPITSRGRFAVW